VGLSVLRIGPDTMASNFPPQNYEPVLHRVEWMIKTVPIEPEERFVDPRISFNIDAWHGCVKGRKPAGYIKRVGYVRLGFPRQLTILRILSAAGAIEHVGGSSARIEGCGPAKHDDAIEDR